MSRLLPPSVVKGEIKGKLKKESTTILNYLYIFRSPLLLSKFNSSNNNNNNFYNNMPTKKNSK